MSKIDLLLPTDLTMVTAATFAGADRPAGWKFLAVVAAMAETVSAKASETEAVVRQRQKQRECLRSGYLGSEQWNQTGSGNGGKKAPAAAATAAKGIGAVVLEAATVVMGLADSSGNGRAGNGSGNRGSGGATTRNQNAAAEEAKTAVVAAAMGMAASAMASVAAAAVAAAAAAAAIKRLGQIVAWPPWSEVTPPNSSERGSTRNVVGEYRRYFSFFFSVCIYK